MALPENLKSSDIDALLNQLEQRIDDLRIRYEQYFMGMDRLPPEQPRRDVVRMVFELEQAFIRNTAQKFRLRSLVQRFNTYKTYWNRIMRQIEEGTFKRDVKKAQRRQSRREERQERDDVYEIDLDLDMVEDLSEIEREFEEMDIRRDLNRPSSRPFVAEEPAPAPAAPQISAEEKERIKQARLREIQAQLMGGGTPAEAFSPAASSPADEERKRKLDEMRRRLQEREQPAAKPSAPAPSPAAELPTGGADYDKLSKLRQMKERLSRQSAEPRAVQRPAINRPSATSSDQTRTTGSQRVIERRNVPTADDEHSRRVYESLIEAKRRCNESTANLSYDAVRKSMEKQREQLQKSRGARDVEFKVVIKEGKAYLKPEAKDS